MKSLTILFCLLGYFASAQTSTASSVDKHGSRSRINVTCTPQWYLNHGGVHNDGNYPDVISAKNTGGFAVGLEYERISRKGFIPLPIIF